MSGITINHAVYVSGKSIMEQLQEDPSSPHLSPFQTIQNVTYATNEASIQFKPILINDKVFKFSSNSGTIEMGKCGLHFQQTYTIENEAGTVLYSKIPANEIEKIVFDIFNSTKK